VLQLRLLPVLQQLKQKLESDPHRKRAQLCLSYVTRRGHWYGTSWKGDLAKSGGVAMNIGIHFFDLMLWLFGKARKSEVHLAQPDKLAGFLELEHADLTWLLSVDRNDLPEGYFEKGKPAYRSLTMDGQEIEFSEGFTELHTAVYKDILAGGGFGLQDAKPSVELVYALREAKIVERPSLSHPQLEKLRAR
jgi:UDP-N-acetyl-2-amino-2-deoxyglucuronate dehydrogenase